MRQIMVATVFLMACGPEVVELYNPDRTTDHRIELVGSPVLLQVEGDVREEWSDPEYIQDTLECCYAELGLDGPTDGNIVVTDDDETFSEYFNFFQNTGVPDLTEYAGGFSWATNWRGKQALGPGKW